MDGIAVRHWTEDIEPVGKIGPNSVVQLGNAVTHRLGRDAAQDLFSHAGVAHLLNQPPEEMTSEHIPAALFTTLWRLYPDKAVELADEAGRRTADYVIAHRIPRLAKLALRLCPKPLAERLLLKAIQKNAWTFAGSGRCETKSGSRHLISIRDNPLTMPDCVWHRAVLARLFDRLVASGAEVRHTACCRDGAAACRFEICRPGEPRRQQ